LTQDTPGFDADSAVTVGRIVGVHGVRGDVKVETLTDFPERFDRSALLWLRGVQRRVERSRWVGRNVYLKLEGIDTRNDAEALRGEELFVAAARDLGGTDVFYQHDLIGLPVEDTDGATLGRLTDILSTGANDVYVVQGERGDLLLPAVEDVVKQIDVAGGRIVVELLPGLEFTAPSIRPNRAPGTRRRARRPVAPSD
jgi:16S rRNA processing protein RimM